MVAIHPVVRSAFSGCALIAACDMFPACANPDRGLADSAGNDSDTVTDTEYENPVPPCRGFKSVWGSGPDDVWAGGDCGLLFHFDGQLWAQADVESLHVTGIWGSAADNVHAVGGTWHSPTSSWEPAIYHHNGEIWQESLLEGQSGRLLSISGAAADDVYSVGAGAFAFHCNGVEWVLGPSEIGLFLTVFAAGEHDIYLLNTRSYDDDCYSDVARFNGVETEYIFATEKNEVISDIWCLEPDGCFAVGGECYSPQGRLYRYAGGEWSRHEVPFDSYFNAVWARSATDVMIVGWFGVLARYEGDGWTVWQTNEFFCLRDIWGSGSISEGDGYSDDVYAVGGYEQDGEEWRAVVLRYDGSAWSEALDVAAITE